MYRLIKLFYQLFDRNFEVKLSRAKKTAAMISVTTNGGIRLSYNALGERIRGYQNPPIKFTHPLIKKYKF
jgi:hypothetical protein